jgi:GTP-binding protein YchF
MKVALLGLPQSGKSTIFSALTGRPAPLPGTVGTSQAIVNVPDDRIDWLTALYQPKKTTYATVECLDLPGISFVDEKDRAASRKLLAQTKTADMVVLVVRAFANPAVPAYKDAVDPVRDLAELTYELMMMDLEIITNRIGRLAENIKKNAKSRAQDEVELVLQKRLSDAIEAGRPLRAVTMDEAERKMVASLSFMTLRPFAVVVNVDEADRNKTFPFDLPPAIPVFALSGVLELELSQLDPESRAAFLTDLGITEPLSRKFLTGCYAALGLISFLTCGPDEVRAWPIRNGISAFEASGKVHSDIQRGFIRAETMAFAVLKELGDEKAVRAAGKARLEGKEYVVQDGDIMDFRFNI